MSKTYKFGLAGVSDNVKLGKNGPRIKGTSNGLEARTSDDAALTKIKIADAAAADEAVTKSQMETAISAAQSPDALEYKGSFDASAGNYNAIADGEKGDYYKISVAGIIGSYDWAVGDNLILNKDVTGTPAEADVDKIDNTESADILRTGDISNDSDFNNDS